MRGPIPTPDRRSLSWEPGPLPDDVMMRETGRMARAITARTDHVRDTLVDIASVLHIEEVMLVPSSTTISAPRHELLAKPSTNPALNTGCRGHPAQGSVKTTVVSLQSRSSRIDADARTF